MTIRWGIIGCGDVTEVKSGPAFRGADGSELVAVMRRSADAARDYAARHAVPRWYDDADALIHDEEVDAVYIATPPGAHLAHALRVAAAGKPCYVEKPMARNHPECRKMVEAFASCGVPLFVAHYRRALPRFLKAKELIDESRIGRVTGVTYHYASPSHEGLDAADLPWRLIAEQAGGGLFMDLGPHTRWTSSTSSSGRLATCAVQRQTSPVRMRWKTASLCISSRRAARLARRRGISHRNRARTG